ncbi:hypothetical protein Tco_0871745, partial [Tanacetum coccineum]
MPTESSVHAESPSMDAELNLTDNETESDKEASKINARNQEEGQAGPNPSQAGPNPGIAAETQLQSSHVVHAGPNLKHMDLGTSDASTQQKPKQMDEEFITTAYPNVQENLKLLTEDQEEEPGKTNAEAEDDAIRLSTTNTNSNNLNNHNNNISSTTSSATIKHRRSDPSKSH